MTGPRGPEAEDVSAAPPAALAALLGHGPHAAREAADRCRAALAATVPIAAPLGRSLLARREATLELAPVWATLALAERLDERALGALAALVTGDGADDRTLARALELPLGHERLDRADLSAAVGALRDERRLGHRVSRRELADHLVRRGRALPRTWLGLFGGAGERRERLLDRGVLAAELARDLARFASGLAAGRLALAAEDLERARVPAGDLRRRPTTPALRAALAAQVDWAREQLALAWALPQDLGPRHAWWAAAWLRDTEGRLRQLEAAEFDLVGRDVEPSARRRLAALALGAVWWLAPRTVTARARR